MIFRESTDQEVAEAKKAADRMIARLRELASDPDEVPDWFQSKLDSIEAWVRAAVVLTAGAGDDCTALFIDDEDGKVTLRFRSRRDPENDVYQLVFNPRHH